jgi:CBS domain-containing protein
MRISDVLAAKPVKEVLTIRPETTVRELLGVMSEHNVGAMVVSADGSRLDGIVSERDVVRQLHLDADVLSAPVEAIMTTTVATCTSDSKVDDLMGVMTERRVRHVPVVDEGVLVGIVSIGDVVKHKIDALQFERDQLDSYVHQT